MDVKQFSFEWADRDDRAGAPLPRAAALQTRLQDLARRGIFLGTSSWKYPGWLGQVYHPARYEQRGRFAHKLFERECLAEYAGVFPTVCGDFSFYQFPSKASWARTFGQLPDDYRFAVKIPEDITVPRFPDMPRYGRRGGTQNAHFMDAELLSEQFLEPLRPYRDRLGPLIFQFGTIRDGPLREPEGFAARLDHMLNALPTEHFKFAVEVRNPAFLREKSYWACLRRHHTAHCLNSWTRMPPVDEQMEIPEAFTAEHVAARFLLRPGRSYQQAVEQFSPYERVQDPYPEGRSALRELIERCLAENRTLFAFVNNRFEGNAIETIESAVK